MPAKRMKSAAAPLPLAVDAASIVPLIVLRNAFRLWRLVAGLMILGGALGWLFHQFQPPVYEAVFGISTGIDLVQTGNLTQFEEDMTLHGIGYLLTSDLVFNQVAQQAAALGLPVDYQALKRMSQAERQMNTWTLRVQHVDVHLAEQVANLWAGVGQAVLSEAYQHAVQAERLARYEQGLTNCLGKTVPLSPVQPVCAGWRFDEIQQSLAAAGQALAAERVASRGLFAGLRLGAVEGPVVVAQPVRYGLGQVVLAGGLIGLLLGVVAAQLGLLRPRLAQ